MPIAEICLIRFNVSVSFALFVTLLVSSVVILCSSLHNNYLLSYLFPTLVSRAGLCFGLHQFLVIAYL